MKLLNILALYVAGWDFIWQRGSAADRNIYKLNRNIGRKSRVFVAFWIGIRKSFILDRNKSFEEQKTKCQQKYFRDLSILNQFFQQKLNSFQNNKIGRQKSFKDLSTLIPSKIKTSDKKISRQELSILISCQQNLFLSKQNVPTEIFSGSEHINF